MKSLLLTVLLLGLVAVLTAQEPLLDDQEDVRTEGQWVVVGDGLPRLTLVDLC